jgi:hypothetical protein
MYQLHISGEGYKNTIDLYSYLRVDNVHAVGDADVEIVFALRLTVQLLRQQNVAFAPPDEKLASIIATYTNIGPI